MPPLSPYNGNNKIEGCVKDLGCFLPGDEINFQTQSPEFGFPLIFYITDQADGCVSTREVLIDFDEVIVWTNDLQPGFYCVKIRTNPAWGDDWNQGVTTPDGACCFCFRILGGVCPEEDFCCPCDCVKDLGCFTSRDAINLGIRDAYGGGQPNKPNIFEVWENGKYYELEYYFNYDDEIVIPNTFNENARVCIKMKYGEILKPGFGIYYQVSHDGHCQFCFENKFVNCE